MSTQPDRFEQKCECGCGQQTTIATWTDEKRGYVKGQPKRFIHNHNVRARKVTIESIIARLEPIPESGCWVWSGSTDEAGYASVRFNGKHTVMVHRIVYEALVGKIAEGLELDHLCRVTSCANPYHLEAVIPKINKLRGNGWAAINARKTHCPKGHPLVPGSCGFRTCKICKKAERSERYQRQKEAGRVPGL